MALAADITPKAYLPDDFGQLLIATASKMSVALQTTTVIPTDSHEFRIPAITEEAAAGWYAENDDITPDDPALGEEVVRPRKIAGLSRLSNELIDDSNPKASTVVGDSIARSIATGIDAAFFGTEDGTGVPPKGLGAFADGALTTITAGTAWENIDPFIEAAFKLEALGAKATCFVANPTDAEILAKLKREADSNEPLLAADATGDITRRISGVALSTSPSVPVGTIYGYDRSRVFTILRNGATVDLDRSVYFASYSTAVRAIARAGFGYPQPKAIARIKLSA